MKMLFILLILIPVLAGAQVNRSARELAIDNVTEYVTAKLFKNQGYKKGLFSELREHTDIKAGIEWSLDHKFMITEKNPSGFEKEKSLQRPYKFIFYLDDRMKVVKAESYMVVN